MTSRAWLSTLTLAAAVWLPTAAVLGFITWESVLAVLLLPVLLAASLRAVRWASKPRHRVYLTWDHPGALSRLDELDRHHHPHRKP